MMVLEFLRDYGWSISIVLQFLGYLMVLWLKDKFAPKSVAGDLEGFKEDVQDYIHDIDKRVSRVETGIQDLPTTKEFHELKLQICDLTGDLKRVDEKFESFNNLMRRTEKQLSLIDQSLRSKP